MSLKRFLCIVLAAGSFACLLATGCSRSEPPKAASADDDTLARMIKSGVMRVGYIPYPPAIIKDPASGELTGDFVEIARYIAGELKLKLEFQETTWSTFVAGLQTHQFDISISNTYIKVGRAANIAFSRPIAFLGNSAGVRRGDARFERVTSPMDFDRVGVTIAVVQGESSHEFARTRFKNAKLQVLSGADLSSPLALVDAGQVDVAMTDSYMTATYCAKNANVRDAFAGNPYDVSPMAWAVRPSDVRLLNFINNSLDFLESSGKLAEWQRKHKAHWITKSASWKVD